MMDQQPSSLNKSKKGDDDNKKDDSLKMTGHITNTNNDAFTTDSVCSLDRAVHVRAPCLVRAVAFFCCSIVC